MKVVVNQCYGGFSVSLAALNRLRELGCEHALKEVAPGESFEDGIIRDHDDDSFCRDIPRDDPHLIQVIEELGEKADGGCASLDITYIPDDVQWEIASYDGMEHVAEKHRTW